MQALIEDLLALACVGGQNNDRQNGGRQNSGRRSIDCNVMVDEVVKGLDVMIRETGAVVHHEALPEVMADRAYLMRIFHNLIGNAIKYRSGEAPVVSILAEPIGQEWLFSVTDNGVGIAPEHNENIFTVFQPSDPRLGSGMGLAMCEAIVEQYGGRIWVESKPGCGSSFKFTLPAGGGHGLRAPQA